MISKRLVIRKSGLILIMAMAGWAICGRSYADTVHGSQGAGFQRWFPTALTDRSQSLSDILNDNGAPYWDYPTKYITAFVFPPGFPPNPPGSPDGSHANVGFCLTGTGNCLAQFLKPGPPPGPIDFWGMPYDSVNDTGGDFDPKVFFKKDTRNMLEAVLELQLSETATELNEFGWFETDANGNIIGKPQPLFFGTPLPPNPSEPPASQAGTISIPFPSPTTRFYAFYFRDVSENCLVATVPVPNLCTNGKPSRGNHRLAVFATDPGSPLSSFWIAGLNDPVECNPSTAADCNLTLVKIQPLPAPKDPAK
jgi:hypothetical protein